MIQFRRLNPVFGFVIFFSSCATMTVSNHTQSVNTEFRKKFDAQVNDVKFDEDGRSIFLANGKRIFKYALDGKKIWELDFPQEAMSLQVIDQTLFVTTADEKLFSLESQSGMILWTFPERCRPEKWMEGWLCWNSDTLQKNKAYTYLNVHGEKQKEFFLKPGSIFLRGSVLKKEDEVLAMATQESGGVAIVFTGKKGKGSFKKTFPSQHLIDWIFNDEPEGQTLTLLLRNPLFLGPRKIIQLNELGEIIFERKLTVPADSIRKFSNENRFFLFSNSAQGQNFSIQNDEGEIWSFREPLYSSEMPSVIEAKPYLFFQYTELMKPMIVGLTSDGKKVFEWMRWQEPVSILAAGTYNHGTLVVFCIEKNEVSVERVH